MSCTDADNRAAVRTLSKIKCLIDVVWLVQIRGGLLADTPGFNVPSMTNLNVINLQSCFPEIARHLETDR